MEVQEIDLGNGAKGVDWHPFAESLKADTEIAPHLDRIPEKDVTSLIKSHVHLSRRLGNAINLPGKDAKPEEIVALKQKLYQAGLFTAPPDSADKYEVKAPETLPHGVTWKDEYSAKAREFFHKNGFTSDQAKAALAFHTELMGEMAGGMIADATMADATLRKEWGVDYDNNAEYAGRAAAKLYEQIPEAKAWMDKTGLGNHPALLKIFHWIGKNGEGDNGFMGAGDNAGAGNLDAAQEANDIIRNPKNDKHDLFWKGDQATKDYVAGLMAKAHPGETTI
jgi:hypothetical protein